MVTGMAAVVIGAPFLAAVIGMLAGRRLPYGPALPAIAGIAVAMVLATWVGIAQWLDPGVREATLHLVPTGGLEIAVGVRVDGLSALTAVMVCAVSLAVQVYSVDYMRGDARYASYSAFISLFTAAMLLVVLSGDLILLYVGWEVMGFCSYALIGHYWYDRPTSGAAVKAFLMTRVGDVGFLFGIFVLGAAAGSFRIGEVLAAVPEMPRGTLIAATLLLVFGVVAKSAQFPLHSWLPDAMAGPTPISALIHAATMVAAGIYVIARLYPAFFAAPPTLDVIAVIAAITMLGSALAAFAQDDLKRVLAYSTVSSLAYMAAGLAAGAYHASVLYLIAHGAFKALLFLCAGAVIHAVGSNLMSDMGALRGRLPVTFATMTVGFAALAGVPPTSGFFGKDAIVEGLLHTAGGEGAPMTIGIAWLVALAALATTGVTAAYATRAWLRTFFGPPARPGDAVLEPHDAPPWMRWPIMVLAVPALLIGFFGLGADELAPRALSVLLNLAVAAAGAYAVYALWRRDPARDPALALGRLTPALAAGFWVDRVYDALVVRPVRALAAAVVRTDTGVVDHAVVETARGARGFGGLLRLVQNGNVQAYVSMLLGGVVLIAVTVGALL